ncbi:MAG: 3-hydroxyacyl-CoA dehydrogenase PaaC [Betaproteobacteria bacterium]|nr:3-hydroxyacyl-CoA dehydrogenase PaaC [Betaproteobacteria bacterium]
MAAALPVSTPIAVVGAGAMGAGIAQVAASAGHRVMLLDNRPGAAAQAVQSIAAQLNRLAEKGKLTAQTAQAASARLVAATQLSELVDCGLVIEAIIEDLQAKRKLFLDLEAVVSKDCILATNTSSISITAIGAVLAYPSRLAGLHFFNPAPLMALVEIVSGLGTGREIAESLFATAKAWGKTPVHARSTPGFIVNRVARPYYAEALRLLQEGAADPATLDACMREAGGFRMGPFELMDLIGHDVNFSVTRSVWNAFFNDPRFLPSLIQQELVDAGFLGRKNGRGFYEYHQGAAMPQPKTEPEFHVKSGLHAARVMVSGASAAAQALRARLQSAGLTPTAGPSPDGRIAEVSGAVLYVTDGRTATRRAAGQADKNVVLIDLALDYSKAKRIAVSVADQCADDAAAAAIGLLQAAGFAISRLSDVPGLAVMRTVAMLANEAADAVNQGVCDVAAVDAAMCLGVNYPAGPLAWADQIGLANVRDVLGHLADSYGEDRYRISPLIQQRAYAGKGFHV